MSSISNINDARKKSFEDRILEFIAEFEAITRIDESEYLCRVVEAYIHALKVNEYNNVYPE